MAPVKMKLRLNLQQETCHKTVPPKTSYRQKLKLKRPAEYEALKEMDAMQHREKRLRMSEEEKRESNRKTRERVALMRWRRKQAALSSDVPSGTVKKVPMTRGEKTKLKKGRSKWAEVKRLQRAQLSKDQRDEINRKRREKYQQDGMTVLKIRQQMAVEKQQALLKEQERRDVESRENEEIRRMERDVQMAETEEGGNTDRSRCARRKALSRARKSISRLPQLYAETVVDLVEKASPSKRAALKKMMPVLTKKTSKIDTIVASNVKKELGLLHGKKKKNDLKRRRLFVATLSVLRKYRLQNQGCHRYGVSVKTMKVGKKRMGYKNPSSLTGQTKEAVQNYYQLHSVELPDQKHVSKKTLAKTRVLELSIKQLYCGFKKDHPHIKVGLTSFFKLRPKHVRKIGSISFRGCLCEYCENTRLKLKVLNSTCTSQQKPECRVKDVATAAAITLCQKGQEKYNCLSCIARECSECGVHMMHEHLAGLEQTREVTWYKWESVQEKKTTKKSEKLISRKVKSLKHGSLGELITELEGELGSLTKHLFLKSWQNEQFSKLTSNRIPEGMSVLVLDFAENFNCTQQDEVQSAYWSHEQVTLHPIVAYSNCHRESCTKPVIHSMVFLSDDLTHDHHAVNTFSLKAVQCLQEKSKEPLTKIVRFSDGCCAQYKSRGPFLDVSYSTEDNGVPLQHNYFASRHGKGPSDGESAVVKRMASLAVASQQASITNAHEMFKYCEAALSRSGEVDGKCSHFQRSFFFVPQEEICRNRQREGKTLPGTRKLHSVETVRPGVVRKRDLSCFCSACVHGVGMCDNTAYVDPWVEVQIATSKQTGGSKDLDGEANVNSRLDGVFTQNATSLARDLDATLTATDAMDCDVRDSDANNCDTSIPDDRGNDNINCDVRVNDAGIPDVRDIDASTSDARVAEVTSNCCEKGETTVDRCARKIQTSSTPEHACPAAYKVGDFVSVLFDDAWWAGEILSVKTDTCRISFLTRKADNCFIWPQKEDILQVPKREIFALLPSPPQPVSNRHLGFTPEVAKEMTKKVNSYLNEN